MMRLDTAPRRPALHASAPPQAHAPPLKCGAIHSGTGPGCANCATTVHVSRPAVRSTKPAASNCTAPAPLAPHRTCANCSTTLRTKLPTMSRVRAPQGEGRAAASAARMLSQLLSVASAFCHGHLLGVGQQGEMCARHTQLTLAAGITASPHTPPRGCKQPTTRELLGTQRLRRRCAMP